MGETKEGLFGEAGDRQGPVCRDLILNEWGCIPEGGEEEGLKLCVCLCVCVCVCACVCVCMHERMAQGES